MSALGAIVYPDSVPERQMDALVRATSQFPHDEADDWRSGRFALASAILHTTAESREASQPLTSADGEMAALFDGYLLYPDELTRDLAAKGHSPRNSSDVEIALCAYRAWGEACAERLEGEFAMIVADLARGRLFAACDHMATIPLYYRFDRGRLLVASDFAIIAQLSEMPLEPDRDYLAQILANRWPLREATPWRGVKRLVRAHTLTYEGGDCAKARNYWVPPSEVTIRYAKDEDYVRHYRELIFDCMRRASRTDRPLAVAVSGGLDSTALFCIADRLERHGELLAPELKGYTLAASEGSNAFELPFARAAARHTGREVIECPLFDPDIEWYSRDARHSHDIPMPSNGAMMQAVDRRLSQDGCRVIVNGSGGDQWLQGSRVYYREFAREGDYRAIGRALREDIGWMGLPRAVTTAARHTSAEMLPRPIYGAIRRLLRPVKRRGQDSLFWLQPDLRAMLERAEAEYHASLPADMTAWIKHNLARTPRADLSFSLMGRQRARLGVVSRQPMWSRRFVEFSCRTPAHIKMSGGVNKRVHRLAMHGILPPKVLHRYSKANFTNTKIDCQFADFVREHGTEWLADLCNMEGVERILETDFALPEGDLWAWEIWGLYASAIFLYNSDQMRAA